MSEQSVLIEVRAFLEEIAGPDDLAKLQRDAEFLSRVGDYGEEQMAGMRVKARQLLDRWEKL